jgi:diguanylate cyclase (GGDEF)-like protein
VNHPDPTGEWLTGLLFLVLFVAAGSRILRLEVRRQAFALSMVEIPFLLGLYYLPPVTLVCARAVAYVIVQLRRHQPAVKLAFNTASLLAETAAAIAIVYALGPLDDGSPESWLILAMAVGVGVLITLAAVVGVITLVQGRIPSGELSRTAIPALVGMMVNTALGLVVLILLLQSTWAVVLLAALVAIFVMAYRSYAQSLRQTKALTEIYDLTRAIADTPHDGTLADVLLGRVRELLQAEYATLWVPGQGRHPELLLSARLDDNALLDVAVTPDALRERVLESGDTVAVGPGLGDDSLRHLLDDTTDDAIVVPMRAGSAVIGCLEVAGRLGDTAHFGPGDVRLLETIAAHAAVAVENSRLVERLRFDAYHDALTGLPNRRRITAGIEESIAVRAPGEVVALLVFDVDGMGAVNASLGHAAGDQLLAEIAGRLREFAPSSALVGRVGGDEFLVTLRLPTADAAMDLAGQLRARVRTPVTVSSVTLDVDTAVGVVVHPDHGTETATLLQRADVAARAAKAMVGGVQLFNQALESRSARRLGLAADLRRALDNHELEVYFQPKVALADRRLVGVECLARWEHPTHGSVVPEDFVAVAEHTGLLGRLTEAVLAEGLRRCRQWADNGHPLSVAVNLSSRNLIDPAFPARVAKLLEQYEVPPERLTFEITEDGVVGESDRPMMSLRQLRQLGVRLSVDDFGTGYSSLSYLSRLPVQEVKIDRSFVQGMATDAGDLAIVRAVVGLARHFGLAAVAEGVESELTLELLEEMGCEIGQGFLFSRPLPYERLEAWFGAQTEPEPTSAGRVRRLRAVG